MCGIVGAVANTPVNQMLYDGLLLLQHRGQDAAGIVTSEGPVFHMYKGPGYVRDVFRTRNMRDLSGNAGIAHCRYPTAGSAFSDLEAQPFYVNSPFGISLGHNGNLTNSESLKRELFHRLGVLIEPGQLISFVTHPYEKYAVDLFLYECELVGGEPRPLNVADFRWVRSVEFDRYPFTPADELSMSKLLGL